MRESFSYIFFRRNAMRKVTKMQLERIKKMQMRIAYAGIYVVRVVIFVGAILSVVDKDMLKFWISAIMLIVFMLPIEKIADDMITEILQEEYEVEELLPHSQVAEKESPVNA